MTTLTKYINDAVEELRHVRWPTRQQAVRLSAIVIIFTGIAGIVLGIIDIGLSEALKSLLTLSS